MDGFPKDKDAIFSCTWEANEVPAVVSSQLDNISLLFKQIAANTFEVKSPAHEAGMVHFWMSCKIGDKKNVLYSNVMTFYVTPCDDAGMLELLEPSYRIGRLNLAFRNFTSDLKTKEMMMKFRHTVRELDLSNNQLSDIDFLSDFHELHTLILDNNQVSIFPNFLTLRFHRIAFFLIFQSSLLCM